MIALRLPIYLRKVVRSAFLSLLFGVVGTLSSGTLLGLILDQTFFGVGDLSGMFDGIVFSAIWGYIVGAFAAMGGGLAAYILAKPDKKESKANGDKNVPENKRSNPSEHYSKEISKR